MVAPVMPVPLLYQLSESFTCPAKTLAVIIISLLAGWIHNYAKNIRLGLPPGLWKLPLIGNLHQFALTDRSRMGEGEQFHAWCEKLGSFLSLWVYIMHISSVGCHAVY
jgi:hypothetical protein